MGPVREALSRTFSLGLSQGPPTHALPAALGASPSRGCFYCLVAGLTPTEDHVVHKGGIAPSCLPLYPRHSSWP